MQRKHCKPWLAFRADFKPRHSAAFSGDLNSCSQPEFLDNHRRINDPALLADGIRKLAYIIMKFAYVIADDDRHGVPGNAPHRGPAVLSPPKETPVGEI